MVIDILYYQTKRLGVNNIGSFLFYIFIREIYIVYYERMDTRKGSEVGRIRASLDPIREGDNSENYARG